MSCSVQVGIINILEYPASPVCRVEDRQEAGASKMSDNMY